jgi:hypothetical protein
MIRTATIDDAFALAPRLRSADRVELEAQGHQDMDVVLAESIAISKEVMAFELDGVVHAVFGVVDAGKFGVPWMLGSDELFNHRKALLCLPNDYVPRWLKEHGFLMNMVHTENHRSIRWLQRIGFTVQEAVQEPGGTFHPFTMGQNLCVTPPSP